MKFKKLIVGAVTVAIMTVSCGTSQCFAAKYGDKTLISDIDENTFDIICKIDDKLNDISAKNTAYQYDIDEVAALLDEYNTVILKNDLPLTQVHSDIIWKTDYILSNLENSSEAELSEIYTQLKNFGEIAAELSNTTSDVKAVG